MIGRIFSIVALLIVMLSPTWTQDKKVYEWGSIFSENRKEGSQISQNRCFTPSSSEVSASGTSTHRSLSTTGILQGENSLYLSSRGLNLNDTVSTGRSISSGSSLSSLGVQAGDAPESPQPPQRIEDSSREIMGDFNGDGKMDRVVAEIGGVRIYYSGTTQSRKYDFSGSYAINGSYDTDGKPGDEIGIVQVGAFSVIHDAGHTVRNYQIGRAHV